MKIDNREFELLMVCLALSIIILGVIGQYLVITSNGCRMPVPNGDYDIEIDDEHFFFNDSKEVELYYLTDIIPIFNIQISIGDLLIFFGMILSFGFTIRYIKNGWTRRYDPN